MNVQGLFQIGLAVNIPQDRKEQVWQFTDTMSYLRGNHSFKFGADLRRVKLTSFVPFDFRASSDFTLNLGLRYERVGAAQDFYSNVTTDNNNFGPRVGFAWDISKTGKTVVRGGYGMAYDQFFLNIPQNNFDFDAEWSRSAWDRPHRLIVSWLWEIPFMRDQQGAVGRVLGGWRVAGNYTAQSGQPFTVITGVDSNGDGDAANDRPNVGTGDRETLAGYIFRPALSGGDGNLGRNSARGPGVNRWDVVLFKNVRVYTAR